MARWSIQGSCASAQQIGALLKLAVSFLIDLIYQMDEVRKSISECLLCVLPMAQLIHHTSFGHTPYPQGLQVFSWAVCVDV